MATRTLRQVRRIAVIGCPGSGKTTLARQLAASTGLPLIHLDYHYYDQTKDYPENKTAWRKKVASLARQDKWIIDGNYKSTFDIRLPRAEAIVLLDFPRRVILWRMLKRRIRYHGRLRDDMPAGWREKISPQFLRFVWRYNAAVRPEVYRLLDKHGPHASIMILKSQSDIQDLLRKSVK